MMSLNFYLKITNNNRGRPSSCMGNRHVKRRRRKIIDEEILIVMFFNRESKKLTKPT